MEKNSSNCDHNCENCGSNCQDRDPASFIIETNSKTNIKKIIGVLSGKGGVGKSLVTGLSAISVNRAGKTSAILDADLTGPSIPKMFGISSTLYADEDGIVPAASKTGIKMISVNLVLEDETDPVVWRGPVITSVIRQFYGEASWGDVDYMFVDMPPGTGDVPLTVFQSLPVDGIIVVASPQELVSLIVEKALKMARMMDVPILGLIENMSYLKCPDCGKEISVFGESHIEDTAAKYNLPVIARIPIDPKVAEACDKGEIEDFSAEYVDELSASLMKVL